MGYKLCLNNTGTNPTEGVAENIGKSLHYYEMYSKQNITHTKS